MEQKIFEFIVVGSGPCGAMSALTLIEKGREVLMLDAGIEETDYKKIIPANDDFISIRKKDEQQHRYFLGDNFEGISWGNTKVGSQLTPPRQFMTRLTEVLTPFSSDSFTPMESLAYGGLGNGWGVGCYVFSKTELEQMGLNDEEMKEPYNWVSAKIGLSAADDDGKDFSTRYLNNYQQPLGLDENMNRVMQKYRKKKKSFNEEGYYLGKPALAVVSKDTGERKGMRYKDMDFWEDADESAYRPWITINALKKSPKFSLQQNRLVLRFSEKENYVEVECLSLDTHEKFIFKCRTLVMAAGVLGSSRIVIRSFDYKQPRLAIICNPYCYIPCLQLNMLGKEIEQFKSSFAQLVLYHDRHKDNTDVAMAAMFTYRSLLLFKLIKESPLNFKDGRTLMQWMQSAFVITGIHHPENGGENKYVEMIKDSSSITKDKLTAKYVLSEEEDRTNHQREKEFMATFRKLGCLPLKRIYPGHGSSIHYAGTLPFNSEGKDFTIRPNGKLAGTSSVFIADGSGFRFLPAKGLTFTLMANAHRITAKL